MAQGIALIVGLGNPGSEYEKTRHNAGAWLVESLAQQHGQSLRLEKKFHGCIAQVQIDETTCRLLIPNTYMNNSGLAVKAIAQFYKITPEEILIVHDEIDLSPGRVQVKAGGGHGGHNGLRDIEQHLGTKKFVRLRIGVGHPGHRDRVHDYVLHAPNKHDEKLIHDTIDRTLLELPTIVNGDLQKAMRHLHTKDKKNKKSDDN